MEQVIGWAGSAVLLATIASQIAKQARERTSRGVSRWLFAGQVTASVLFVVYSVLVANWVFVVTNALILLSAVVGVVITWRNRRRECAAAAG